MRPLRRRVVLAGALCLVLALPSAAHGGRERQGGRFKAYLDLLEAYRTDPATAASKIAWWTDVEVMQASDALVHSLPALSDPVAPADVRLAFTAVMLHTDAAMRSVGDIPSPVPVVHLRAAVSILDAMGRRAQAAREFPFVASTWHLAVVCALTAYYHWGTEYSALGGTPAKVRARIEELTEAAERECPGGGADLLLALATLEASAVHLMAPTRELLRRAGLTQSMAVFDMQAREAEGVFRQALARNGTLLEARLRLGQLLLERGRRKEAGEELRRVLAAATDPWDVHLACLFMGRVAEENGDTREALTFYERAVAAWPSARTARVALASAHEKLGEIQAARASIAPLLDAGAGSPDPWGTYFVIHAVEGRRALDEMRRRVTGRPGE